MFVGVYDAIKRLTVALEDLRGFDGTERPDRLLSGAGGRRSSIDFRGFELLACVAKADVARRDRPPEPASQKS